MIGEVEVHRDEGCRSSGVKNRRKRKEVELHHHPNSVQLALIDSGKGLSFISWHFGQVLHPLPVGLSLFAIVGLRAYW